MSEATVIALGFFDGVHLGHGALLRKTAEHARELGVTPAAFTFDRSQARRSARRSSVSITASARCLSSRLTAR